MTQNIEQNKPVVSSVDSKNRKTYRAILEISKSLDEIYKSSNSFLKIFQSETTLLREKLRQNCENLILRQPLEYGKKAEEILWRRVFYEIIRIVKASKKKLDNNNLSNTEIETMYRLHLSAAYGYYNHLILKLQSEFNLNLNLDGFLDFPISMNDKSLTTFQAQSAVRENSHHLKELIIKILHKLLICLGDLARYQIEYDPFASVKLSQKYYMMALLLVPENGQPLNQMGTLFGSENYGVDAAYYYIYCLSCSIPFNGAKENLKLLFSKNRKRYEEIKSINYSDQKKQNHYQQKDIHAKAIKKFLVLFLYIIDQFSLTYLDNNPKATTSQNHLQELCQLCLQEFNSCMFYKSFETGNQASSSTKINKIKNKGSNINDKLAYLPNDLVFKLAIMILMTIERLKKAKFIKTNNNNKDTISTTLFTAIAFSFIFFSHIINHSILRFQEEVFNLKKLNNSNNEEAKDVDTATITNDEMRSSDDLNSDDTKRSSVHKQDSNENNSDISSIGSKKKKIHLIFGRRRRQRNSDSDTNSQDSDSENFGFMRQKKKNNSSGYVKHEYLSEDELNDLSTDGDDDEDDDGVRRDSKIERHTSSSSSSSLSPNVTRKVLKAEQSEKVVEINQEGDVKENEVLQSYISKIIPLMDANKSNISANFKDFSTQLFTNYSLFESKFENYSSAFTDTNELIDNEVYKNVLNGHKQVSVPPGFENNSKEVLEIEELGKKLASFEIETDTEMSMFNSDTNASNDSSVSSGEESENSILNAPTKKSDEQKGNLNNKDIKAIVDILYRLGLLPAIKIFCDWMLCNKKLIQSISKVSQTIWSRLAILLNCTPLEKELLNSSICGNNYVKNLILKSFETISWNTQPLAEDMLLRSFDALKLEHSLLKYDLNSLTKLNGYEETLIRICSLRRFGYSIASLSQSQQFTGNCFFTYNASDELFVASTENENEPVKNRLPEVKAQASEIIKTDNDDRKLKLMKDMAQLRLQAEISQLENSYKVEEISFSPYLIVEVNALCMNLKVVQDLSRSNKFIIIIPLAVIDSLDEMKKNSKLAREAIRWLENQFKHGNRFIRAQVQNETSTSKSSRQVTGNLKNKDLESMRISQLVDCCKYFQENHNLVDRDENVVNMVTLLVSSEVLNDEHLSANTRNLLLSCQMENINFKNIIDFHEKWKSLN